MARDEEPDDDRARDEADPRRLQQTLDGAVSVGVVRPTQHALDSTPKDMRPTREVGDDFSPAREAVLHVRHFFAEEVGGQDGGIPDAARPSLRVARRHAQAARPGLHSGGQGAQAAEQLLGTEEHEQELNREEETDHQPASRSGEGIAQA
jgi:hypothetical protein